MAWWTVYHSTTKSVPATLTEGIDCATHAIAIDPYDAELYHWRADAYDALGDTPRAQSDRDKAHRLDPED